MKKPLIGVLGNIMIMEGGMFPGIEKAYVNNDYVEAVMKAGGIPVIIPVTEDEEVIKLQLEAVDGVLMSGGYDLNPLLYGEEPIAAQTFTFTRIDKFYLKAIKLIVDMKKPILGICKGHQALNVAFGGTLYQDLSQIEGCYVKHSQSAERHEGTHCAEIVEGTKLFLILGKQILVNSYHHQAIKDLAEGFVVSAKAKDGVIEAIEKTGEEFIVGVQWHPEMMASKDEKMLNIIKKLVEASSK